MACNGIEIDWRSGAAINVIYDAIEFCGMKNTVAKSHEGQDLQSRATISQSLEGRVVGKISGKEFRCIVDDLTCLQIDNLLNA